MSQKVRDRMAWDCCQTPGKGTWLIKSIGEQNPMWVGVSRTYLGILKVDKLEVT